MGISSSFSSISKGGYFQDFLLAYTGFALPLATFAKCENKICLVQKILILRNQVEIKMKIGTEVLQVSETIWTVIKSGYCILHLCQIG